MSNAASDCDRSLNLKLPHIKKNIFFVSPLLLRVTDLGECFFIYIFSFIYDKRATKLIFRCVNLVNELCRGKKSERKKIVHTKNILAQNVVEWVRERGGKTNERDSKWHHERKRRKNWLESQRTLYSLRFESLLTSSHYLKVISFSLYGFIFVKMSMTSWWSRWKAKDKCIEGVL